MDEEEFDPIFYLRLVEEQRSFEGKILLVVYTTMFLAVIGGLLYFFLAVCQCD